jgi:acyl-CoA thioesterase
MSAFDRATAVQRTGEAVYSTDLDVGWSIGGKPNGGYLLAVTTRAVLDAVDRPHALAVSGHFLRPPSGGPAEVRVERLREGRSVATVRATLMQGGVPCLDTLVTAGRLEGAPADWSAATPPDLPPPEKCLAGPPSHLRVELLDHVDVRLDPATAPFGDDGPRPTGTPELRGWVRFHDGAENDTLALALVVDAMPPTVFNLDRWGWAPTVELTFLLRGIPAPGWLACEATTRHLADGWFDEAVEVWDESGHLVAQSRQLARAGS